MQHRKILLVVANHITFIIKRSIHIRYISVTVQNSVIAI